MRRYILLIYLFAAMQYTHATPPTTTASIQERIRIKKQQLRSLLRHPVKPELDLVPAYYDSNESAPIPPISEKESHIESYKIKLKTLKTRKARSTTQNALRIVDTEQQKLYNQLTTEANVMPLPHKSRAKEKIKNKASRMSMHIFYRKSYDPNDSPEFLHCSDLITPFYRGSVSDIKPAALVGLKSHVVQRLLHLLSVNATNLSRAEKRSVMYQISKIKIRLFYWNAESMSALLNLLIGENQKFEFITLKQGIKRLFETWNTDLSNTTSMLLQSRIFRPPCLPSKQQGSSKLVRGSTVPTIAASTNSLECVRRDNNNC